MFQRIVFGGLIGAVSGAGYELFSQGTSVQCVNCGPSVIPILAGLVLGVIAGASSRA